MEQILHSARHIYKFLVLILIFLSQLVAQVKIQEKIVITPQDSVISPSVFANIERMKNSPRKTSDYNPDEVVVAMISETGVYYVHQYDYKTFFHVSGSFTLPAGAQLYLKGGWVPDGSETEGIGADDDLSVKINGVEVLHYSLTDQNGNFVQLLPTVWPITSAHTGTNSYEVTATDTKGYIQWMTPLRLTISDGLNLVITQPTACTNTDPFQCNQLITANPPTMPVIVCKAKLVGNSTYGAAVLNWTFRIESKFPKRTDEHTFVGNTVGYGEAEQPWTVPLVNQWWGGHVYITVSTMVNGITHKASFDQPYDIVGVNPDVAVAKSGASREMRSIMQKESNYQQFVDDQTIPANRRVAKGYTLWGKDRTGEGGYGICQITSKNASDPDRPSVEELWNWQSNRARGTARYALKYSGAQGYAGRIQSGRVLTVDADGNESTNDPVKIYLPLYQGRTYTKVTALSSDQLRLEAFQRYRGGVYWVWGPYNLDDPNTDGEWVPAGLDTYGDEVNAIWLTNP